MSFLNPAILIALSAIAIPILIHLLNLRKVRKIEFSTLMFLKEIQKSKMRKIQLKQIILLLLRIGAIAFLVLCFAQPVYEGYAGDGNNSARSTTIIFIDDSFSMSSRDNNGMLLAQAKDAVKKILDTHSESDDIYLIPTSEIAFKKNSTSFNNFIELLDSLDRIKISNKPMSVNEAVSFSNKIFGESKNSVKEIFIVSDFQKNNFSDEMIQNDFNEVSGSKVNTYLVKTGSRDAKNLSLDSLTIVTKILEKDKDVKVKIYLNNNSEFNVSNKIVNLYVNGELKGEKAVDVGSFDKKEIEFIFKTPVTGSVNGFVELVQNDFQDDELLQDNKYYFSLFIPDHFNIGLISQSPADRYFIDLALQSAADLLSDSTGRKSGLFRINYLTSVNEDISNNDVVFISNKNSFTDSEAGIIKDYVSNGGGVFIFMGSSVDVNNYNNTILSKLDFARIQKLNMDAQQNANLKFDKIDFENPVLSEVFSNKKLNLTADNFNIESPKINSFYELLAGDNSNTIVTFSNNKPFLVESTIANGKVILSSLPATDDLSDFPLKSIFVPVIIRSIYYLSNDFEIQKEYIAGNSNLISIKGLSNVAEFTLPDKSIVKLEDQSSGKESNYLYLPYNNFTAQTGTYTAVDSAGGVYNFSLNYNSKESNLQSYNKTELEDYFRKNNIENVSVANADENIVEMVQQSRSGFSLWKYFLIGALLFVAAELLLSKKLEEGA